MDGTSCQEAAGRRQRVVGVDMSLLQCRRVWLDRSLDDEAIILFLRRQFDWDRSMVVDYECVQQDPIRHCVQSYALLHADACALYRTHRRIGTTTILEPAWHGLARGVYAHLQYPLSQRLLLFVSQHSGMHISMHQDDGMPVYHFLENQHLTQQQCMNRLMIYAREHCVKQTTVGVFLGALSSKLSAAITQWHAIDHAPLGQWMAMGHARRGVND